MRIFQDRADGGRALAKKLRRYMGGDVVVYGLPRGGVVTARAVADELQAPLDLIVARKVGHPGNPEYAIGAVTDDGESEFDEEHRFTVAPEWLETETARQVLEACRRRDLYLTGRTPLPVAGKIAILVDDGIATGYTIRAAIRSLRKRGPAKIVVAVPVASESAVDHLRGLADEVVVVEMPAFFYAVGQWYENFAPVEDSEVVSKMQEPASN